MTLLDLAHRHRRETKFATSLRKRKVASMRKIALQQHGGRNARGVSVSSPAGESGLVVAPERICLRTQEHGDLAVR